MNLCHPPTPHLVHCAVYKVLTVTDDMDGGLRWGPPRHVKPGPVGKY